MAPPDENTTDNSAENHLRFDEPKFDTEGEGGRKQSGVDHKGSIYAKPDLENGEEYANLVAYISSYYEGPRRKSVVSMEAGGEKKPWWKFWSRGPKAETGGDGALEIPDDVSYSSIKTWTHVLTDAHCSGSRPTSSRVSLTMRLRAVARRPDSMSWSVLDQCALCDAVDAD